MRKRNMIKKGILVGLASIILFSSVAIWASYAQSLSEGLWKEFVEEKPEEAVAIYEHVVKNADDEEIRSRAASRLEKLTGFKPLVISIDLGQFIEQLVDDEDLKTSFRKAFLPHLAQIVGTELDVDRLPRISLLTIEKQLDVKTTDMFIEFAQDIDASSESTPNVMKLGFDGVDYELNAFPLSKRVVLITVEKRKSDVIAKYNNDFAGIADKFKAMRSDDPIYISIPYFRTMVRANQVKPFFEVVDEMPEGNVVMRMDSRKLEMVVTGTMKEAGALTKVLVASSNLLPFPGGEVFSLDSIALGKGGENVGASLDVSDALKAATEMGMASFVAYMDQIAGLAREEECKSNIRKIMGVQELYRMEHEKIPEEFEADPVGTLFKEGYLKEMPVCPDGGIYRMDGKGAIECSIHDGSGTE